MAPPALPAGLMAPRAVQAQWPRTYEQHSICPAAALSPEAVLFEGTTDDVIAPAFDREAGALTRDVPMMTLAGSPEGRIGTEVTQWMGTGSQGHSDSLAPLEPPRSRGGPARGSAAVNQ